MTPWPTECSTQETDFVGSGRTKCQGAIQKMRLIGRSSKRYCERTKFRGCPQGNASEESFGRTWFLHMGSISSESATSLPGIAREAQRQQQGTKCMLTLTQLRESSSESPDSAAEETKPCPRSRPAACSHRSSHFKSSEAWVTSGLARKD